jgi:hypothetical protein
VLNDVLYGGKTITDNGRILTQNFGEDTASQR